MGSRITKYALPESAASCPRSDCVYNEHGTCDEVLINYENSDAECHEMSPKAVLILIDEGTTNE